MVRLLGWRGGRTIDDEAIIRLIRSGQDEAFRLLVDRYRAYLFQAVFAVLRDAKTAEDVTQEAFLNIYRALPRYENQGFKTWITRIAVNRAIDERRREIRRREVPTDGVALAQVQPNEDSVSGQNERPDSAVLTKERREHLQNRLDQLPDGYRSVVHAHYFRDQSYKEIAEETGLEPKTVKMRLYRAKQWMRKHWKEGDFR